MELVTTKKSRENSRRAVKSELGFMPGVEVHRRLRSNEMFSNNVGIPSGQGVLELSHDQLFISPSLNVESEYNMPKK